MILRKKNKGMNFQANKISCCTCFNPRNLQYSLFIHFENKIDNIKWSIAIDGVKAIKNVLDTITDDAILMREIIGMER